MVASDTPQDRPAKTDRYHHGNLPDALRESAAEVLAERGVSGFSLREVARRAEVSHAAPAHHFGDARGLLTAVAVEAFQHLVTETEAAVASADGAVDALAKLGRAYVTVSIEHPGHCAVVFDADAVDAEDPAYAEWGTRAFGVLVGAIERLAREENPDLDVELAAFLCWSMVQGLVDIHGPVQKMAAKRGTTLSEIPDLAESFTHLLIAGLVGHPPAGR